MKYCHCIILSFTLLFCACTHFSSRKAEKYPQALLRESIKKDGYCATVYFDVYSYELGVEYEDSLMRAARLHVISDMKIYLSGHADKTGEKNFNMDLSAKRVGSAKDYLMRLGVKKESIYIEYFGDKKPAVEGDDLESYAKNRRVEIILIDKKADQINFTEKK